jgi:hypothetical protein
MPSGEARDGSNAATRTERLVFLEIDWVLGYLGTERTRAR